MDKTCPRCKKTRLVKFFSRNRSKKDGLAYFCKPCQNQYTNDHYQKNKGYYVSKAKKHKDLLSEEMRQLKSLPCTDCEKVWPWYVMDFDHVRGKKTFNISSVRNRVGRSVIAAEIKKCDLVCANCHRERTFKRSRSSTGRAQLSES